MQFWVLCRAKVRKCFQQLKKMIHCYFNVLQLKIPILENLISDICEFFTQENAISTHFLESPPCKANRP